MKTPKALSLILSLLFTFVSQASQPANVRMHCWSLRFHRATANDGIGFQWRLDMTTLYEGDNGELALDFFGSGFTHSSYVDLYYEDDKSTYAGAMALDVPDAGDSNGNGFPDFFEVSQAVDGLTSDGVLDCSDYFPGSAIQATWFRDGGSSVGYCRITVPDPWSSFGTMNFVHQFDLIEYKGELNYTPGADPVAGLLSLSETNTGNTLNGPVMFERSVADPANKLSLQSAFLTNNSLEVITLYTNTSVYREATYPTNYFGSVELQDGDLSTVEEDYYSWQISIDDTNDADMDGIPDFSDDPTVTAPAAPTLSMALGTTNVWITISGEVGHLLEIQSAGTPLATNWTTVHSVTLTNNPQTEFLPQPVATTFWRARIPAGQ